MDFYQVLEKRRTIRDFSDKEVTEEVLEKVLSTAFKAPTNDHLRQFEFIVVRGQENIARLISAYFTGGGKHSENSAGWT
mgnify:CR=1 FL=1